MPIGDTHPPELVHLTDGESGRALTRYTAAAANSYPLYYFVPSHTADGRYLVFHSERTGWVQLYRLDLTTGEITQLTDGTTRDSGWAIWCEPHLRGIYNHLSALEPTGGDAFYFQGEQIHATNVYSLEHRLLNEIPSRIPIGQTGFSPDGKHFAFIHADRALFTRACADREALINMRRWNWGTDHDSWRHAVPSTISLVEVATGVLRDVIELDHHVHHVFFLDAERLLVNHPRDGSGMWTIRLDGTEKRVLRPADAHGSIVHQVVTANGIYYEACLRREGRRENWFGRYDPATDTFGEVQLPGMGYVHTGFDPAGKFLFFENDDGGVHQLLSVHFPRDPDRYALRQLKSLAPIGHGQRYHAHPFLSPDRTQLFFTELIDGFSQICALDVADLVDLDEYWDCI